MNAAFVIRVIHEEGVSKLSSLCDTHTQTHTHTHKQHPNHHPPHTHTKHTSTHSGRHTHTHPLSFSLSLALIPTHTHTRAATCDGHRSGLTVRESTATARRATGVVLMTNSRSRERRVGHACAS